MNKQCFHKHLLDEKLQQLVGVCKKRFLRALVFKFNPKICDSRVLACLRACVFACVIPSFVLRSLFVPAFLALLPFLLVDQIQESIFVLGKRAEHMAVVQRLEVAFSPSSRTGKNMEAGKNEEAYYVRNYSRLQG